MKSTKLFTLIFVKKNKEILLGHKTRGLGKGLWNGFGGKIEPKETIFDCAKRELFEECSIIAKDLKHLGVVMYEVQNENVDHIVHVFTCSKYIGSETSSEEMNPVKWFTAENIPYDKMWPDAQKWWPYMLNNSCFSVYCIYNNGNITTNKVLQHDSIEQALTVLNL